MVTFVIVHGTWGTKTKFTALKAGLNVAAGLRGLSSTFEDIKWSGRNSVRARHQAASEIEQRVNAIRKKTSDEPVLLIGHSHGGSAIAYFFKNCASARESVAGCAFLSTPFVAMRPREYPRSYLIGLGFLLYLGLIFLLSTLFPAAFSPADISASWDLDYWTGLMIRMAPNAVLIGVFAFSLPAEKMAQRSIHNQTVDCNPPADSLFLRFTGDEAAAAMSALQFFAWVSIKVSKPLRWFWGTSHGVKETIRQMGRISISVIILMAPAIVTFQFLLPHVGELGEYFHRQLTGNGTVLGSLLIAGLVVSGILTLAFALVVATAMFSMFFQTAAAKFFGWTGFMRGFFVELAVEPIPLNGQCLHTFDWGQNAGLVHGWTYAHPAAIALIERWARSRLSPLRTAPDRRHARHLRR